MGVDVIGSVTWAVAPAMSAVNDPSGIAGQNARSEPCLGLADAHASPCRLRSLRRSQCRSCNPGPPIQGGLRPLRFRLGLEANGHPPPNQPPPLTHFPHT